MLRSNEIRAAEAFRYCGTEWVDLWSTEGWELVGLPFGFSTNSKPLETEEALKVASEGVDLGSTTECGELVGRLGNPQESNSGG